VLHLLQWDAVGCSVVRLLLLMWPWCDAVCCSVLQCVAVRCSGLQCGAFVAVDVAVAVYVASTMCVW